MNYLPIIYQLIIIYQLRVAPIVAISYDNVVALEAEKTIGYETKHHQSWFDDNDAEIKHLINNNRIGKKIETPNFGKQNIKVCALTNSEKS